MGVIEAAGFSKVYASQGDSSGHEAGRCVVRSSHSTASPCYAIVCRLRCSHGFASFTYSNRLETNSVVVSDLDSPSVEHNTRESHTATMSPLCQR